VKKFNFADSYRAAGLTIGPDILRMREDPFKKLRQTIDPRIAIDLVRLYFDLDVPRGTDWFRDAFSEADPSFSLIDNAREVAVLAAGLLEGAADDGKVYAALATLTTAVGGFRQPAVRPELIEGMRVTIQTKALSNRQDPPANPKQIKRLSNSSVQAELEALTQSPDLARACALLKQASEESSAATKALISQVLSVVQPLATQVLTLREEVEMLWWHIGGWSRMLEKPFAELDVGLAAVLAGIDMADMSRSATGPAAAPAVLQRTLLAGREVNTTRIAIKDAVDALPEAKLDLLTLAEELVSVPDVCPLLTAFAKAKQVGVSPAWHKVFAKATGLEAESVCLAPLELAMQAHREQLLLRALK